MLSCRPVVCVCVGHDHFFLMAAATGSRYLSEKNFWLFLFVLTTLLPLQLFLVQTWHERFFLFFLVQTAKRERLTFLVLQLVIISFVRIPNVSEQKQNSTRFK